MATTQLVSGTGDTLTCRGFRLTNYPWVYFGGDVDTIVSGGVTYYGLDNSVTEVVKLCCYKEITIAPSYNDFEDYCDGVKVNKRKLDTFQVTLTVTEDIIDLRRLRYFMRQSSGAYDIDVAVNTETLLISDLVSSAVMPVLFEQHYTQEANNDDQYIGILAFEAELSLGDIDIDPDEGYNAELTIDIRRSTTYGGFMCWMRKDTAVIIA